MTKRTITALILLLVPLAFSAYSQEPGNSKERALAKAKQVETEVRTVFDSLMEGIRKADVEKVMNAYRNDDRTLFFNYNGTVTTGWRTMYENRKSSYPKRSNISIEPSEVRVEVLSPTSAYLTCRWKQTQDADGKLEQSSGRMTLVFKKFGKEWKIVHLHTSPDTFPSALMVPGPGNDQ